MREGVRSRLCSVGSDRYRHLACSEGDDVAGSPADSSSPRALQAPNVRSTSSSVGQRRRRTIYIAGRECGPHVLGSAVSSHLLRPSSVV